jgi:hypothetical protein
MLTLFSVPKPFRGHIGIIQRNAVRSWTMLRPACEILLFGDEEGTAELAKELGVRHIPQIARNEHGTPLVNDLFARAESMATHDLLCYVNADIIMMSNFMSSVKRVSVRKRRFLMVGQRWNVEINEELDFCSPDWEVELDDYCKKRGELFHRLGIDYFVFHRGLFKTIPPFAIGRLVWDNWLVFRARIRLAAVVDATPVVMAVHQNHDYGRFGGKDEIRNSPEAWGNLKLSAYHLFTLDDATHVLLPNGLQFAWSALRRLPRQLAIILFPSRLLPVWAFIRFYRFCQQVRST